MAEPLQPGEIVIAVTIAVFAFVVAVALLLDLRDEIRTERRRQDRP